MTQIMIYGQTDKNKDLCPVVFQLASKSNQLTKKFDNATISVFIAGAELDIEKYKSQLSEYGVDKIIIAKSNELAEYNTRNYAKCWLDIIKEEQPKIILIGATKQGRDIAPFISSSLNTGLTADCTGLEINETGALEATRPTFGGELMATILCKTLPQMATIRPNVFDAIKIEEKKNTEVQVIDVQIDDLSKKKILELFEIIKDKSSIENAKILFVGGKGLKDKSNFDKLYKLAEKYNAQVGATRKVVEMGWAEHSIQIGQTGTNVSPDLYIGFGVSGAIQHCVGISNAKKIIAINNDRNAPITKYADLTIVADAIEVLRELTNS